MTPQWKKRLAKEWLSLLICLAIGFLFPLLFLRVASIFGIFDGRIGEGYAEFLSDLVAPVGASPSGPGPHLAKLFVLGPYVIYQLVRSIIWAIKVLRVPQIH